MEKMIEECFNVNSEYYKKMVDKFKEEQLPPFNKHHIVPRSYFKKKGLKLINKNNIVKVSIINHLWIHYYAFKCANPIIKNEMAAATKWIFSSLNKTKNITEEEISEIIEDYAEIRNLIERNEKKWNLSKSKKILCLEQCKVYNTIHECETGTNCDFRLISKVINNKRLCVNGKHFIVATKDNYSKEECEEILNNIEKNRKTTSGIRRKVLCVTTGEIFENGRQAALKYNIKYTTVNSALHRQKETFGYFFKYIDDNDRTFNNISAQKVMCIETQQIFNSLAEAERAFNSTGLSSAIINNHTFKGYHWKKLSN